MSSSRAHCGQSGHDSQACVEMGGGFKLFGVRFSMDSAPAMPSGAAEASSSSSSSSSSSPNVMRKSFSMGNLRNCKSTERESLHPAPSVIEKPGPRDTVEGYASDDFVHSSSNPRERKKGIPWTKEEHVSFLLGLEKLGKSEWRGIARDFVKTRTPTQVASHAQKYFLRRNSTTKRRRRSSLFDIIPKMVSNDGEIVFEDEGNCEDTDVLPELTLGQSVPHGKNHIIDTLQFSPKSHPVCRFSDAASLAPLSSAAMIIPETNEISNGTQCDNLDVNQRIQITYCDNANLDPMNVDCMGPLRDTNCNRGSFCSPSSSFAPTEGFYCVPYSACWGQTSNIVKPMPRTLGSGDGSKATVHSKDPCINTMRHVMEPTPLSYKLMQEGSRQSAFHVLSQQHSKEIDGQGNTSNAISVL